MGLRQRILNVVALEGGGPRKRNVLATLPRSPIQAAKFDEIFSAMLHAGELVRYGDKRWSVYGPPGLRWRRGEWVHEQTAPLGRRRQAGHADLGFLGWLLWGVLVGGTAVWGAAGYLLWRLFLLLLGR